MLTDLSVHCFVTTHAFLSKQCFLFFIARQSLQESSLVSGCHWVSQSAVVRQSQTFTLVDTVTSSSTQSTTCCTWMASRHFHMCRRLTLSPPSTACRLLLPISTAISLSSLTVWKSPRQPGLDQTVLFRQLLVLQRPIESWVCLHCASGTTLDHDHAATLHRQTQQLHPRWPAPSAIHRMVHGRRLEGKCRRWRSQDTRDRRIKERKLNVALVSRSLFSLQSLSLDCLCCPVEILLSSYASSCHVTSANWQQPHWQL